MASLGDKDALKKEYGGQEPARTIGGHYPRVLALWQEYIWSPTRFDRAKFRTCNASLNVMRSVLGRPEILVLVATKSVRSSKI